MNYAIKHYLYAVLLFPLLFSGCLRTYYPMHYAISPTPMTFETELNRDKVSKYIGAELTTSSGFHDEETITLASGIFSTAYTTDYSNINLEAFGYYGNYKVAGISPKFNGNKTAFGLGGNFKLAFNFKTETSKLGIGFNLGLKTEFGDYNDFRINASKAGLINGKVIPYNPTFSVFPFLAFDLSKNTLLSMQVNIGVPEFITPSIMLNTSNISIWISFSTTPEDTPQFINNKFVLGVKYRL